MNEPTARYDHYTVYPLNGDPKLKQRIEQRIRESWLKLHTSVGEDAYVADFIYDPLNDRAILIELGPFLVGYDLLTMNFLQSIIADRKGRDLPGAIIWVPSNPSLERQIPTGRNLGPGWDFSVPGGI